MGGAGKGGWGAGIVSLPQGLVTAWKGEPWGRVLFLGGRFLGFILTLV